MAERVLSEGHILPDGRRIRVIAYDDGSVRFRVTGTPYVLEECYLQGGTQDHAIVKLTPKGAAGAVPALDQDSFKSSAEQLLARLRTWHAASTEDETVEQLMHRSQREAMISLLTALLLSIESSPTTPQA